MVSGGKPGHKDTRVKEAISVASGFGEDISMASSYPKPEEKTLQTLRDAANRLRIHSIRATCASNSGHPTSCCSAAEIMSALFFHTMRYKPDQPGHRSNDRFVLSKGHAAPVLYAAWAEAGYLNESDLLKLRKIDCDLEGHPTPRLPFVDVATGSLGQGLGAACGMAYTGKYFDKASYRVYCLLGDGESSEGSVWEGLAFGSQYQLDNLVAIFDVNRLGQSEAAPLRHDMEVYRKRCEAFGWNTYVVDGHKVEELCQALWQASQQKGKPTAIVAKTFKGRGIAGVEDADNWHGKPMPKEKMESIINALQGQIPANKVYTILPPAGDVAQVTSEEIKMPSPPAFKIGEKMATRKAYGLALAKLGSASPRVVALDGDTKNSTFAELFKQAHPERYIECFIAEQNMVSVALGCAARNRMIPFASSFAAFFTRAFDHIRMAAISHANIKLCGSHCGVSIGVQGSLLCHLPPSPLLSSQRSCEVRTDLLRWPWRTSPCSGPFRAAPSSTPVTLCPLSMLSFWLQTPRGYASFEPAAQRLLSSTLRTKSSGLAMPRLCVRTMRTR
ncbi:Transketolase like 2 [Podarcis lilfordi]|uniref:Transketolase like 2 n=1 Tax=Podarcis lilfordi TaxID=74358 RepID=A0AA35KK33_9SAUR|nr:Transketolase like 2 [Podarcis lilfordi]